MSAADVTSIATARFLFCLSLMGLMVVMVVRTLQKQCCGSHGYRASCVLEYNFALKLESGTNLCKWRHILFIK